MALLQIGDVGLRVRAFGDGPTVLLLHGLGSSGDDWAFQVGPLALQHRVIVPDLRGCGGSEVTAGRYSIAQYADDMWRLLDHCGETRPAVVGFSMGGAVALEMALQRPQAVHRLVLINSLPSYRIDHWRKALELYLQIGLVRLLGIRRSAAMIARRLFPLPHQTAMRERVIAVVGSSPVEPYLRCARALADWCAAERIDALQAPTLMLAGEHDYTGLAEKQRWAQRMRAQLAVVHGSRHGTPFDAIQASNACLLQFLAAGRLPEAAQWHCDRPEETPRDAPPWPAESALPQFQTGAGQRPDLAPA